MKLIITRSFSKTKQVAAFEPINASCSVSAEITADETRFIGMTMDDTKAQLSDELDTFVRQEVERTIEGEMKKVAAIKKSNEF